MGFSKKIMQGIAQKLRRVCCEDADRARQARIDELSVHQERNLTTVSQSIAQIPELKNILNSLSDAREFYDPESGSSSGATHVPDRTSGCTEILVDHVRNWSSS